MLNVINRFDAEKTFPGQAQAELDRTRYSVDLDKGLFKVLQTKRGKNPKKPLSDWKTVERELISDDPDVLAQVMFGKGTKARDIRTFEGLVAGLRKGPMRAQVRQILAAFAAKMRELVAKKPHTLGDDPEQVLDYIYQVAKWR